MEHNKQPKYLIWPCTVLVVCCLFVICCFLFGPQLAMLWRYVFKMMMGCVECHREACVHNQLAALAMCCPFTELHWSYLQMAAVCVCLFVFCVCLYGGVLIHFQSPSADLFLPWCTATLWISKLFLLRNDTFPRNIHHSFLLTLAFTSQPKTCLSAITVEYITDIPKGLLFSMTCLCGTSSPGNVS